MYRRNHEQGLKTIVLKCKYLGYNVFLKGTTAPTTLGMIRGIFKKHDQWKSEKDVKSYIAKVLKQKYFLET